jgi:hypothetical protein
MSQRYLFINIDNQKRIIILKIILTLNNTFNSVKSVPFGKLLSTKNSLTLTFILTDKNHRTSEIERFLLVSFR